MRVFIFLFLSAALLASCQSGNNPNNQEQSPASTAADVSALEEQVMAIHDEAMPRLNEINQITARLREIKSDLKETPEGKIESPEGLDQISEALKLAEQGMWDWMKSYNDGKNASSPAQLAAFLENELIKVTKVRDDINSSIERAQTWLSENAPAQ